MKEDQTDEEKKELEKREDQGAGKKEKHKKESETNEDEKEKKIEEDKKNEINDIDRSEQSDEEEEEDENSQKKWKVDLGIMQQIENQVKERCNGNFTDTEENEEIPEKIKQEIKRLNEEKKNLKKVIAMYEGNVKISVK